MKKSNFHRRHLEINFQRTLCEKQVVNKLITTVFRSMRLSFIRHNYHLVISKEFTRLASQTRTRNYCSVTMRSRSVYRAFQMSRYAVHAKGSEGLLLGVSKAS